MIRVATPRDAARIAEIFSPFVRETVISFADVPLTSVDFEQRITQTLREYPYLVLEEEGRIAAYAYASKFRVLASYRWVCETSLYVDRAAHRRGAGTRLYTALLALLRRQGFQQAYAGITIPNAASVAIHEKFGFRFFALFEAVGFKHGEWRDVGFWALRLQDELPNPPGEPKWFAALQENESTEISRILSST
jgi:L-amino acid N-acyltransferase YncA